MKKLQSVAMMGMLALGGLSLVSCSNDENEAIDNGQAQQTQEVQVTLESVLNDVNQRVAQIDYSQLAPLAKALDVAYEDSETEDGDDATAAFIDKLRGLLKNFQPTTSESEWNRSYNQWTYANIDSTLVFTLDALIALGNENAQEGELGLTQQAYSQSLTVAGEDSVVYTIQTRVTKEMNANGLVLEDVGAGQLVVYAGSEVLLSIDTHREQLVGLKSFKPVNEYVTTGSLTFAGNVFTLGYSRNELNSIKRFVSFAQNGMHVATLQMTVGSDFGWETLTSRKLTLSGEVEVILMGNLAAIRGTVTDLGRFYQDGTSMVQVSKQGTSMENCQRLTQSFNSVASLKLLISGTNAAQLKVAAVQTDATLNLWKPVVMVNSPIIGKREMTIAEVIDAMGISFSDIVEALLGKE